MRCEMKRGMEKEIRREMGRKGVGKDVEMLERRWRQEWRWRCGVRKIKLWIRRTEGISRDGE
jgi:hypothetical protein